MEWRVAREQNASVREVHPRRKKDRDNVRLAAGFKYNAEVIVSDPDGDELTYVWEIKEESNARSTGGDRESIPKMIPKRFEKNPGSTARFRAPNEEGAYRLFIYVYDGNNHAAHANIPFLVE